MSSVKNGRLLVRACVGLIVSLLAVSCASSALAPDHSKAPVRTVDLTVSAAASLENALEAIAPEFHVAYPTIEISYNFGASGALQQQIEQGAPADVFFSAAVKQMDVLAEKGLILKDSRRDVLTNTLVLIAPVQSQIAVTDMAQIKDAEVGIIAVGEFRSVPAGQYTEQVFTKLNLLEPLRSKLVFSNNVRGVLAAVESGNADLGLVYATDAALSERVKVLATASAATHQPIVYPIAVVSASPNLDAARMFIAFLQTPVAQTKFKEFGFGVVAP
ncbi:molybdate ABC transporter substrate-binding protein [Phormidium tenue]|uniref:Molybdate ABC transporter substrate-binding protein n=1 Tax=Phormidium tenue NIES-30 TaxID=549789 RepID=A0A1U7IYI2_9CYAN|nr:molybdate ABC transporter substrate-binding protein [Phormidium tenue]MBD2234754.1 molybdate ABC transporter substrate-binding protein [Phormidium tenue FACHB-1052]OKH43854.1 molybdate ABC transporter substrate-binding protein [Phormidium tenue NIES-30]